MTKLTEEGRDYRYTECGLDNIYLANGFTFVDRPAGRELRITNIEGLHEAIGKMLITNKKDLSGKEIRFLRKEMLMSQPVLAKLLGVAEQTVLRWEKGKAEIPKPAETLIRLLYREYIKDRAKGASGIQSKLKDLADLEDAIDGYRINLRQSNRGWQTTGMQRAA